MFDLLSWLPFYGSFVTGCSFGGKKGKAPTFEFQPYGGLRPPRIDYTPTGGAPVEILRPTQKQIFDLLMAGSKGGGVGFDPARRQASQALLESTLRKQREDDIREARGRVSASGLSGNLRAQEALTGRVERDYGRTLGEGTNLLNIEDLTIQQQERERDKRALEALNRFNFGQEDTAADFDLSVYGQEQANRQAAAASALQGYGYDRGEKSDFLNSLLKAGGTAAGGIFGGPAGAFIGSQAGGAAAQALSGRGIAPQYEFFDPNLSSSGGGYRKPYRALRR